MKGQLNFPAFIFASLALMVFILFLPAFSRMANDISTGLSGLNAPYLRILPPLLYFLTFFTLVGVMFKLQTNEAQ